MRFKFLFIITLALSVYSLFAQAKVNHREIINQYAFDHDLYCEFTDASDLTDSEIPESISHYNCWDTNDFLYSTLRIHRSIERSRNAAQIGELEKITEFPAPGESGIIPVSVQLYPKVKP